MTRTPLRAILIAGPTAAGKSELATCLAERFGSAIINADSMQVYREWKILTARPTESTMACVPHHLYGHVSLSDPYSVGRWLEEVRILLEDAGDPAHPPVIVGGTGNYFTVLTRGLAPLPKVSNEMRREIEQWIERVGLEEAGAKLEQEDPQSAAAIDLRNPRRVARAWEILRQTGSGMAAWHSHTAAPLLQKSEAEAIVLSPERSKLASRIDLRFDEMMEKGALQEVRSVCRSRLDPSLPGMFPLGARELATHLDSKAGLEEALQLAKRSTRQYAKRQSTWFRNQMADWHWEKAEEPGAIADAIFARVAPRA